MGRLGLGLFHTLAIKNDGEVDVVGRNNNDQKYVSGFHDLVALDAGVYRWQLW